MTDETTPPWPERPALFLDLDGTLLEFAAEPHRAVPSERLRELLPSLQPATDGAIALITGRTLADLDRLLVPHRFAAAGIHGLERRDGSGRLRAPPVDRDALAPARRRIAAFVAEHEGLALEDKSVSLALHYRQRPDLEAEVRAFVQDLEASLPAAFELLPGRMVFEIKPGGVDKGEAIAGFMREPPFAGRTPVFVGDDVTDEHGFEVVNALSGVSVKVDSGPTCARWRLPDVAGVLAWLEDAVGTSVAAGTSL
jgi:trehalose 6-phosphate phosphatase